MSPREAFELLTLASARDGRHVDEAVARVWASDLSDVSALEAAAAAREHYRSSSDWLMPAHVLRIVRARRAEGWTMSVDVPEDCGRHRWLPDGTCLFCTARIRA